jgi:hypothetical protein
MLVRIRPGLRFGLPLACAVAILSAHAAGAKAPLHHHLVCSPAASILAPQLLSPCDREVVHTGIVFTFQVRDRNSKAHRYPPFINLTRSPPSHGILKNDSSGDGLFDQLVPVRNHRGLFAFRPRLFSFPGYWLTSPGKWYVQIQQVDCTVRGCVRYSPVETITVRGA